MKSVATRTPRSLNIVDAGLNFLLPVLVVFHLCVAPYTKVEESFNLQATHDILHHGFPTRHVAETLRTRYDHFSFPGAVPRTFVGALVLSGVVRPAVWFADPEYHQLIVRGVLGLFNVSALLYYKQRWVQATNVSAGRWLILLLASQFHIIYYATRTLPNMFAFGFATLALADFLPTSEPQELCKVPGRQRRGICYLVFAGIVFRSELALLLGTQLSYMLWYPRISLETIISTGLRSASVSLALSISVDSYFWQSLIWPELAGFYYNAIQGKSVLWGTSPFYYYFTHLLPKLLLNPFILIVLLPLGLWAAPIKTRVRELMIPSLLFVALYSTQGHKEARFIIYVIPPLTAAASYAAAYLWTHRAKGLAHRAAALLLAASLVASFLTSTLMLVISSLNYPGGHAITQLNRIITTTSNPAVSQRPINVHMDILSCMTGVTRFLQLHEPSNRTLPTILYDKTEDDTLLRQPEFWDTFDYALMEQSERALGSWDIMATIYGYAGIEVLRMGEMSSLTRYLITASLNSDTTAVGYLHTSNMRKMVDWMEGLTRLLTRGWSVGIRFEPKIKVLRRLRNEVGSTQNRKSLS